VSLRRSPTRTAAFLAANRSNARRSTGPRTAAGKARVAMNSVRRGTRAFRLRGNLAAAGAREQAALYDWILGCICFCYEIPRGPDGRPDFGTPEYAQQVERLTRGVFMGYQRALATWRQAKPQSPFDARVFANAIGFRFRIRTPDRTRALAFRLQPGRGPNYFRPSRLALPGALRARLEEAWAREPEDPLAYVARLQARLGSAAHTNLWAGCRILPPTPRVTIYRRAEAAPPQRRAERRSAWTSPAGGTAERSPIPQRSGFVDDSSQCFPGARRRATVHATTAPVPRTRQSVRRVHAFFHEHTREAGEQSATFGPVRRFLSGIVGALFRRV
jgi:hypothetical protein